MFEKKFLAENDFKVLIKVVQINYASFWHLIGLLWILKNLKFDTYVSSDIKFKKGQHDKIKVF